MSVITAADMRAAADLLGLPVGRIPMIKRGKAWDPNTQRWYKDGFAPFQLSPVLVEDCLACGGKNCLYITSVSSECVGRCSL